MAKHRLKFTIVCLMLATVCIPCNMYSCAGGDFLFNDYHYTLFDCKKLVDASLHDFLYCPDMQTCEHEATVSKDNNVLQWLEYIGSRDEEAFTTILYHLPTEKIEQAVSELQMDSEGSRSALVRYLKFARSTENVRSMQSGNYRSWYEGEEHSAKENTSTKAALESLLLSALQGYNISSSVFYKQRYGFQIIRLYHYLNRNSDAVLFFENEFPQNTGYIYFRALEQYAGALYNEEEYTKSYHEFMRAFHALPSRRVSISTSLRWNSYQASDVFSSVSSNAADFMQYFLTFGSERATIEEIYARDIHSPYLKLLYARALAIVQADLFAQGEYYSSTTINRDDLKRLLDLANRLMVSSHLEDREIWTFNAAVLHIALEESLLAREKLATFTSRSPLYYDAQNLLLSTRILSMNSWNSAQANALFLQIRNHAQQKGSQLELFMLTFISEQFFKENPILYALSSPVQWYYPEKNTEYLDLNIIYAFKQFIKSEQDDSLPLLTHIYGYLQHDPHEFIKELEGTYYLKQGILERARGLFLSLKKPEEFFEEGIRSSMFSASIRPYFNLPFENQSDRLHTEFQEIFPSAVPSKEWYIDNKIILIETLQRIEERANTYPSDAAKCYMMLGNAWHNMSETGWFTEVFFYSGNNSRNDWINHYEDENNEINLLEQRSLSYYQKALAIAQDREVRAKLTFLIARVTSCYTVSYETHSNTPIIEFCGDHETQFETLANEYDDTRFAQEVSRTCSFYRMYKAQ